MYVEPRKVGRDLYDKIEARCIDEPYGGIWMRVSAPVKCSTPLPWFRLMDQVVDRGWRLFSPEVSGNRL